MLIETAKYGEVPAIWATATHDPETGEITLFAVNRDRHGALPLEIALPGDMRVAEHLELADDDPSADPFADVWAGNTAYAEAFALGDLSGHAARGLTVVTCMDSRIDPLAVLGLVPGDAKIIRSAGARITENALRSLILAVRLLGGGRVLLMPHTDCGLVGTDDGVREKLAAATGRPVDDPAIARYRPRAIAAPTADFLNLLAMFYYDY